MTNLFLLNDDVNVIVIDWGGGSSGLYSQTAANTRLVGLEVSALIDYLMEYKGARLEDFHLVGHSLGSHIAGRLSLLLIALFASFFIFEEKQSNLVAYVVRYYKSSHIHS